MFYYEALPKRLSRVDKVLIIRTDTDYVIYLNCRPWLMSLQVRAMYIQMMRINSKNSAHNLNVNL